jgi:hypothetical protein
MAHAARLFLTEAVQPATRRIVLVYPGEEPFQPGETLPPLYRMAWEAQVQTAFDFSPAAQGERYVRLQGTWYQNGQPVQLRLARSYWVNDTRQMLRDPEWGFWELVTPTAVAVTGPLGMFEAMELGTLRVQSTSSWGTFVALALDGRPLERSRRVSLKFVGTVYQDGTRLRARGEGLEWLGFGIGPVRGNGKRDPDGFRIEWQGRGWFHIPQRDGLWEILWEEGKPLRFWSDTAGVVCEGNFS